MFNVQCSKFKVPSQTRNFELFTLNFELGVTMEAYLYEKLEDQKVRCNLCGHHCLIKSGRRGICGVRENRDGALETLVFGRTIAQNVDPIEKKPLFHLLPGSRSYSIATVGCNFKCRFCQNADIGPLRDQPPTRRPGDFSQ